MNKNLKIPRAMIVLSILTIAVFGPPVKICGKPITGIQVEASEYKTLYYDNGVYYGETIGNKPNGYGTFETESGVYYEGEWYNGIKTGSGKQHLRYCSG